MATDEEKTQCVLWLVQTSNNRSTEFPLNEDVKMVYWLVKRFNFSLHLGLIMHVNDFIKRVLNFLRFELPTQF